MHLELHTNNTHPRDNNTHPRDKSQMMHLEFYLHNTVLSPINFVSDDLKQHFSIKLTREDNVPVRVGALTETEWRATDQQETGRRHHDNDLVIFSTHITSTHQPLALTLSVYRPCHTTGVSALCAAGRIPARNFAAGDCEGRLEVELYHVEDPARHMGSVVLEYLLICPWQGKPLQQQQVPTTTSRRKTSSQSPAALTIGHRGCGSTSARRAEVLENTVESFMRAHAHGADYAEFDVSLTRDQVPVVFHDFQASVRAEGEDDSDCCSTRRAVPVKDLTLSEIRASAMDFAPGKIQHGAGCQNHFTQAKRQYADLLPTLQDVIASTPTDLGLLLEVKYPLNMKKTGESELAGGFFPRNVLVDRILDVVMGDVQQGRKLVFCCFDPQVCALLQRKQSRHAVVFLAMGDTLGKYEDYADPRSHHLDVAASFAKAEQLQGLSVYADPFADNRPGMAQLLQKLQGDQLQMYTWGKANSSADFAQFQRRIGVSGIIMDGVDKLEDKSADAADDTVTDASLTESMLNMYKTSPFSPCNHVSLLGKGVEVFAGAVGFLQSRLGSLITAV